MALWGILMAVWGICMALWGIFIALWALLRRCRVRLRKICRHVGRLVDMYEDGSTCM